MQLGILNVLHSIDGKEFITEKQIEKEICDELYVHDGIFLCDYSHSKN
jgi:hypothetical protein